MSQAKKLSLYELNPRYFKDNSGNGVGDLQGLAAKFDYLKFLGVDGVILQDLLSTDSKDKFQNFQSVSTDIGELNDLVKVLSFAKANGTKVLIELNIGSIKENHKWFESAIVDKTEEFENVIETSHKKEIPLNEEDNIAYKYASEQKTYYLVDSKTQEIPLNWKSEQVMEQFLKVIRFWRDLGISGFVFKNFEYIADFERKNLMSDATLKELRKFYRAIKNVEDKIVIVGKSDVIKIEDAHLYTSGITQVLDYFLSTSTSLIGTKNGDPDMIGKFKAKALVSQLKKMGSDASNIISFGSPRSGRIVSRWGNDNQYHNESAKAFAILLHLTNASSSIYYGDEIGAKNIGLTHLDDFQDETLSERKRQKTSNSFTEEEFMDAQVLQNPINSRSLMAWNANKNGGFSVAEKTITPVSFSYGIVNVESEYADEHSILHFYRELLKIVKDSSYSPVIAHGKFKISSWVPGVIKVVLKHNNKEVIALVNTSNGSRPIYSKFLSGKVVISTYHAKQYHGIPKSLEPFEGIIISKHTDEYLREKELAKQESAKESARIEREKLAAARAIEEEKQRKLAAAQAAQDRAEKEKQLEIERMKAEEEAKAREKEKQDAQAARELEKQKTLEFKLAEKARIDAERESAAHARELEKQKTLEIKLAEEARIEAERESAAQARELEMAVKVQQETEKQKTLELKIDDNEYQEAEKQKTQELQVVEQSEIEKEKAAARERQEALKAALKDSKDRSSLTDDQVAKTTQVNVDTENIEDFIQKLNKKEK